MLRYTGILLGRTQPTNKQTIVGHFAHGHVSHEFTKTECTDIKITYQFTRKHTVSKRIVFILKLLSQKIDCQTSVQGRFTYIECILHQLKKRKKRKLPPKVRVFLPACFELLTECKSFVVFHKPALPSLRYLTFPDLCSHSLLPSKLGLFGAFFFLLFFCFCLFVCLFVCFFWFFFVLFVLFVLFLFCFFLGGGGRGRFRVFCALRFDCLSSP